MISKGNVRHDDTFRTYIFGHSIPLSCFGLVAPHIVQFADDVDDDVHAANTNESTVSTTIHRTVVFSVDVRVNDTRQLHKHVVQRSTNGSSRHCIGVARSPADVDGVWRRERE